MENLALNIETQISLKDLVVALGVGTLLAYMLRWHFIKFGRSVNNRKQFGDIFILIVLTTTLIITLIKTSLALSLGLVGALSIVRFRTPIKEPEELAYLFVAIAIGLGLGANQLVVSVVAFVVILVVATVLRVYGGQQKNTGIYLSVESDNADSSLPSKIKEFISGQASEVEVRRLDFASGQLSALFVVSIEGPTTAEKLFSAVQGQFKETNVTLIDREVQVNV